LKAFSEILLPSTKLQSIVGVHGYFKNLNDKDFKWLLSIPIAYFKFSIRIEKASSDSCSAFTNFINYLQELHVKMLNAPQNLKLLYRINNK